jgi:hypothetical protein
MAVVSVPVDNIRADNPVNVPVGNIRVVNPVNVLPDSIRAVNRVNVPPDSIRAVNTVPDNRASVLLDKIAPVIKHAAPPRMRFVSTLAKNGKKSRPH